MENIGDVEEYNTDRVINILQNGDKFQKKQILKELKVFIEKSDSENLKIVFSKLLNFISLTIQDKAEMCRENATGVCVEAMKKLQPDITYLSTLIPVIHHRLCSDLVEEPSEELRLLYINLVYILIEKHGNMVTPYIEELVEILCKAILDGAPEVKKKGCFSLIKLADVAMYEFQSHSKKVLLPLSESIKHQHWRVRVAVIEAYETAVLKGDPKILPEALPPLTNRFFDDTPHVRMAVTKLIGNWMLNHYDRYSYYSQMLPLILTSLSDSDENISKEAHILWDRIGNQYMKENEKDLKDKIDWGTENLEHYPTGVTRPCLGCRTLVEREVGKFALAIGKELGDWVVSVRIMSAQLLSQVVLHAEHSITQDLHKIILPMSKAAMDEEAPVVIHYVLVAAEYLGYFVPPKTYCALIVQYITEATYGELRIVAGIVRGSKGEELRPHLKELTHLLGQSTFKGEEQLARLDLICSLFKVCGKGCFDIGETIWSALVSVAGLAASEAISIKANELLEEFCKISGEDRRIAFNRYCKPTLASLLKDHWTVHCYEQFIFTAIVCYTGEIIEENIDTILEIFQKCLCKEETDPECILKVIIALNKIITDEKTTLPTPEIGEKFKDTILEEVLFEQLKWKAGRTAEAVRTMAATSLFLLLPRRIPPKLLPVIISLVEDPSVKTRQLAIGCLTKCASLTELHNSESFTNIVTAVLKRLDDSDQKVRTMSVECIVTLYKEEIDFRKNNSDHINNSLLDFVFSTLLIHLDDHDSAFQKVVFSSLKSLGMYSLEALHRKIRVDKFRDKDIACQLITYLEEELKKL